MEALAAADGERLALVRWPHASPRGLVLLVHGLGEHIGRYGDVAARLQAAGWAVAGHDQRGHGQSGGARGVIPRATVLYQDLATVIDTLRPAAPGPLVLLGHSMGGALAARFAAEALAAQPAPWSRPLDGLVLSSPALAAQLSRWQRLQLALGERLAPGLAQGNGIDSAELSHDVEAVRAYDADPLVHDRISARLARCILDAGDAAIAAAPRWRLPTLLMWGGADRIVAPEGSRAFAAAAPPALLSAFEFAGLRHELFNESERDGVFHRLTQWLRRF